MSNLHPTLDRVHRRTPMHGVRTTEGWVRELQGRCLGYIYRSTC